MINCKDVTLAIEIRGREHVSGKLQMSDVGVVNTSRYRISDASEKSALDPRRYEKGHRAEDTDWSALMRAKAALQIAGG